MNHQDWTEVDYRKRNNLPFVERYPNLRTVLHRETDAATWQFVELKPQKRQIRFLEHKNDVVTKVTRLLPFPYMYFLLTSTATRGHFSVKFGISNTPINNFDDLIYMPPLANIFASFAVCLGENVSTDPIADMFNTRFHPPIARSWAGNWVFEKTVKSFDEWEKIDPLTIDWPLHTTVENFFISKPKPPKTHLPLDLDEKDALRVRLHHYSWAVDLT